jgi:spore coat polysaccharide biosynthesis protein SpsF (cytidylyltransferase family)
MKVTAIIQARLGSSRLPGKTLMEIEGVPLLGHLLARVRAASSVDEIVIATTGKERDDRLAEYAKANGFNCFRGSEDDVLDRFHGTAEKFGAEVIVRVTPDCPMLDPDVLDGVVAEFLSGGCDYASNTINPKLPDGMDVEVFSFQALGKAWREAKLPSEREHVTPYIKKHPELFKLKSVEGGRDLSSLRLTVDEESDFNFARAVFSKLYQTDPLFGLGDILALLAREPALLEINQDIQRNEGYLKSLKKDEEAKRS